MGEYYNNANGDLDNRNTLYMQDGTTFGVGYESDMLPLYLNGDIQVDDHEDNLFEQLVGKEEDIKEEETKEEESYVNEFI